jgi:putative sterol carrier protein
MIEDTLVAVVDRFNRRVRENPGLLEDLRGKVRRIRLDITGGPSFALELQQGVLSPPRMANGEPPDVRVQVDEGTFQALLNKEIGPIKALYSGRLKIDASFEDKLLLRKLF